MSIQTDLARNRAVFAALTGETGRGTAHPAETARTPPPSPRAAELPQPLPPAPLARFARADAPETLPRREEPRQRIVHTLGNIPGASRPAPAEISYPAPVGERPRGAGDGPVSDMTYKSLLRRFDQDARRQSQPGAEEGLL